MVDRIEEDSSRVVLARALTSHSWGQSSEDLLSGRSDRASASEIDSFMYPARFHTNLVTLKLRLEDGSDAADIHLAVPEGPRCRDEHSDW